MIPSFRDSRTHRFARGERVKQFVPFRRQAENRLVRLEVAGSLQELAALRGNGLEMLSGDLKGQWSMRINGQWRICFRWDQGEIGPSNVEIADNH
jgi:proteic killer suppression protein